MAKATHFADFSDLRAGFTALSDIYEVGGQVQIAGQSLKLSGIPRQAWWRLSNAAKDSEAMIRAIVQGSGQRSSVAGRREVVLSAIMDTATEGPAPIRISALLVHGRGAIRSSLSISTSDPDWITGLRNFTSWEDVDGVIAAAEGNNQRALIGLVLMMAEVGRGRLEMIEAELPEEIDEAAQMVRGADWLKAGLPRFQCAAGEALWYLMRIRSVHARMIRARKQGYYSAMGVAALYASGVEVDIISEMTHLPAPLVEKLLPASAAPDSGTSWKTLQGASDRFAALPVTSASRRSSCARKIWKGVEIYLRVMDRRIRLGGWARERLGRGEDLVSIAATLKISRRDLIRILSVNQQEAVAERERFINAVIDPISIEHLAGKDVAP